MKKFIAALMCAGLIAVTAAGCGYSDALLDAKTTTNTTEQSTQAATEDEVTAKDYKNDLSGLIAFFKDKGYLEAEDKNVVDMDASSIGAKSGKKYTTAYEGKNVVIELYEYDTNKLTDTAKAVVNSVKENGTFQVFDLPAVPAYLSNSGKFMLIYTDKSISKDNPDKTQNNYKHFEEVLEAFNSFDK